MTKNAKKLLEFLRKYIEKNKISPNYEEMKDHMGLKSKSSIFQYLEYLEELGHIKKDKLKSRSIELNSVIPFYNEISAGKPIDVLNDQIEYIDVNNFIKSDKANCIACKVHGNSMESYGIFEDDIIIVERVTNYNSNDIHAVQIDDSEITLKKIKLIKDEVEIFGDHKNFSSVRYKKDRVKILGKMVNLVRKY
jgi:repressor LexA